LLPQKKVDVISRIVCASESCSIALNTLVVFGTSISKVMEQIEKLEKITKWW